MEAGLELLNGRTPGRRPRFAYGVLVSEHPDFMDGLCLRDRMYPLHGYKVFRPFRIIGGFAVEAAFQNVECRLAIDFEVGSHLSRPGDPAYPNETLPRNFDPDTVTDIQHSERVAIPGTPSTTDKAVAHGIFPASISSDTKTHVELAVPWLLVAALP